MCPGGREGGFGMVALLTHGMRDVVMVGEGEGLPTYINVCFRIVEPRDDESTGIDR